MFNQIRAEFYKLFHTKALYLTFALILAVFGIFSIGGQQQFVASSSSLDETWKIGETVGFLARAYSCLLYTSHQPEPAGNGAPGRHLFRCTGGTHPALWHRCSAVRLVPA